MELGEYDHRAVEAAVRELWEAHDIYRYDRDGDGPVFSVDTPPPYVSAAHLHVGHAMSYSQPDFIVRYRRMRGERVFYPIGFDDNGLPTERYVEQAHGVRAVDMPRAEFNALCLAETGRVAERYEDLWRRLGLSVDWSLRYSTIDARCQRTAQTSFVTLHQAGYLRRAEDPILWCPEDRTSLAQADVEDLERTSRLHTIRFGGDRDLLIATTRPELLPACVALYHHPADTRYDSLERATVPLFGYEVPVRTDESVDPEYGTGLMMVCTFGDSEDVLKWRRDHLDLRLVVEPDGRLGELAGEFAGLTLAQGRSAIVKALDEAGLLVSSEPVRQVVGVHERCQTPLEFQIRPQWFIAVREHADRFRARAAELEWIPPFMRRRLEDWIDGLKWDWNITRQRRYGVPFPVWFCTACAAPVLAIGFIIGFIGGIVCYGSVCMKPLLKYDDSLDAFGVHGVGGTIGALLTGVFAMRAVNPIFKDAQGQPSASGVLDGNPGQLLNQFVGVAIAWTLAAVGTVVILKVVDLMVGLRVSSEHEIQGLDLSQHGEEGYYWEVSA